MLVNEVTFGKPLGHLKMRARCPVIKPFELSVRPPPTSGEGRGAGDGVQSPMAKDVLNHSCAVKLPEASNGQVPRASGSVNARRFRERVAWERGRKLRARRLPWARASLPAACSLLHRFA